MPIISNSLPRKNPGSRHSLPPTGRPAQPLSSWLALVALFLLLFTMAGCDLFTGRPENIFYLGWTDSGSTQLFQHSGNGERQQMTRFDSDVRDYAVSPDGRRIVAATGQDGGSQLWILDMNGNKLEVLHECVQVECLNLVWAPDGRRVMFEQRLYGADGVAGSPTLWWLDVDTAEVRPVLEEEDQFSANGRLSPDGRWLSYVSPNEEGLFLYNFVDGRTQFVLNEIGAPASWSPNGEHLVVPRFDLVITHGEEGDDHQSHEHDYETAIHLFLLDVESETWQPISGELPVEDSVPVWSPDGKWIAFGRRALGTGSARQIWLTRPDGSEMHALTQDARINHGPPSWSSDGRFLLFQQILQDDLEAEPSIWRIDVQTGEKEQMAASGMQPVWQPSTS